MEPGKLHYSLFIEESDDYDEEYNEEEVEEASKQELTVSDLMEHFADQIPEDPIGFDMLEHFNEDESISVDKKDKEVNNIENEWKFSHCSICYDDMSEPCVLECGHYFCLSCLEQFIKVSMDSGNINTMACPDLSCGKTLTDFDIRCILPTTDYSRFSNISNTSYTKRRKDEVWCPRLDCSGCAKNIDGEQWLCCTTCNNKFCSKCRNAAHEGKTCSKAKKERKKSSSVVHDTKHSKSTKKQEKSTKKWASKNTKLCPRCGEVIQKNGGCHHVNCTTCGHQFCWLCMAPADGPFHCRGKKVAVIIGSVLLSPVLIIGGVVTGGAYLVESRVIRRGSDKTECVTYEPVKKISEKISMEIYWLID